MHPTFAPTPPGYGLARHVPSGSRMSSCLPCTQHCGDRNSRCRSEMNVQAAWKRGYTGKNVVVTILDDGIERNHPDLAPNYVSPAWGLTQRVAALLATVSALHP